MLRFRFARLHFRILSFLFFLSALRRFRSPSGFPNALSFAFALLKFSPFTLSRFQYSPSGSAYSARCSFPFILPCFAPTAVPQVLTSASLRLLQVTFVCSLAALSLSLLCGLEPDYSALCFFLSLLLTFPSQWFLYRCFRSRSRFRLAPSVSVPRSRLSSFLPACFHAVFQDSVLSFAAHSFLHGSFASQRLPSSVDLCSASFRPLPFRPFPLACALGSAYSALGTTYPEN